ncbi:MAG: hypothetical protein N3I35_06770 [Clostridia bacterium]|nr:hypothetical protein [Clostridia bacterium]
MAYIYPKEKEPNPNDVLKKMRRSPTYGYGDTSTMGGKPTSTVNGEMTGSVYTPGSATKKLANSPRGGYFGDADLFGVPVTGTVNGKNVGGGSWGLQPTTRTDPYGQDKGSLTYKTPEPEKDPSLDINAYMSMIGNWQNALRANEIAQIDDAYNKAMGIYQNAPASINQNANNALSQNDNMYYTQALPAIQAAAEQAGVYRGGDAYQQNTQAIASRMNNASSIERERGNQLNQVANALTQLQAQRPIDIANATSSLDAAAIAKQVEALQNVFGNKMQYANTFGTMPGSNQQTLAAQNQNFNNGLALAGVTGYYNGAPTMAMQQFNADNSYRDKTFDYQVKQDNRNYNYQVSRDKVLDDQWLKQFNYQQQQDILNRALQNKQISIDEYQAKTSRINANTNATQAVNQQNNYLAQQEQDKVNLANQTFNNYVAQIDNSMYVRRDPDTNEIVVANPTALRSYILSLYPNTPEYDSATDKLLARYGLL